MSNPFVAEIRMVAFNFPPTGWAFCDGQLMPISQNTALFSLLGTTYGGNGKSNFALPNFQGRSPTHHGQSNTGTWYFQGEELGVETVTLIQSEIPAHTHQLMAEGSSALVSPNGAAWGTLAGRTPPPRYSNAAANVAMNFQALNVAGGSLPHNNMQPYLVVNFIIAMQGIFPPRT